MRICTLGEPELSLWSVSAEGEEGRPVMWHRLGRTVSANASCMVHGTRCELRRECMRGASRGREEAVHVPCWTAVRSEGGMAKMLICTEC